MLLPQMNEIPHTRQIIDVFSGYNHNPRINEGEFYDERNMSSQNYPVLSSRAKRGVYKANSNREIYGMIAKDGLGVFYHDFETNQTVFEYNGKKTSHMGIPYEANIDAKRTVMVSMGLYVIIFAWDKDNLNQWYFWVNTSTMEFGTPYKSINIFNGQGYAVNICDIDGNDIEYIQEKPQESKDGQILMNTNTLPIVPYKYSQAEDKWIETKVYTKITHDQIYEDFEIGDVVNIKKADGEVLPEYNQFYGYREIVNKKDLGNLEGYLVVDAIIPSPVKITEPNNPQLIYTITRDIPQMDFVVESGNRLWGCRYGTNADGNMVNEIYASKLGDFKNWYSYKKISTDSYYATLGSDGAFTGAISYLGYPIFFKENYIHKIYGTEPSNFQLQTSICRGVELGSEKSLAMVNEVLYYKSRQGICIYDGSLPTDISQALGGLKYSNAVAGGVDGKYYVSMIDEARTIGLEEKKTYVIFVFDSKTGLWHKEDDLNITMMTTYQDVLYYVDSKDKGSIKTMVNQGNKDESIESTVRWMAETGDIGTDSPDTKYISKINLRVMLDIQAEINLYIRYNSTGDFLFIGKIVGSRLQSFSIPITPKRCDHFRLRFEGQGDVKIFSITKTIEQGGEA